MQTLSRAQLERVISVGRSLVSSQDPEEVLRLVLTAARDLTGAQYAAIGVLDARGRELERFLYVGIDDETRQAIGPLPRGRGLLGELISHPEPLRIKNISRHPHSYGFPASHPPMESFLGVPLRIRDRVYGNVYLTEKLEGAEFTNEDEHVLMVLADWAAIAIENARALESSRSRRQEIERVAKGLEATASLGRELGGEVRLERVLELVVKRARALLEARSCICLTLEPDGVLRVADIAGDLPDAVIGKEVDTASPIGDAMHAPVEVAGLGRRWLDELGVQASRGVLMPLRARGQEVGVLGVFDPAQSIVDERIDTRLTLEAFAASAAAAIGGTRRIEDERLRMSLRSAELERKRWARELHDEALQELGALQVVQESALAADDIDQMKRILTSGKDQVERSIESLRDLIADLRPASLDQLGIAPAVEALVDRVVARGDLAIDLEIDLDFEAGRERTRLNPELESGIYRVLQEALNNIVKHAEASRVQIRMLEADGSVTLTVEDDGRGMRSDSGSGSGFGLVGMRERVELLHGELEIGGKRSGGTQVVATFPSGRA
jgi:two-component system, NarL family, sensor histidine kinase DevS